MTNTEKRDHILEQAQVALLALHNEYANESYVHFRIEDLHYKVVNSEASIQTFINLVLACPGFKTPTKPRGPNKYVRPIKREVFERRYANDNEVEYEIS